ncbi:MATE family efflux transporter [Anaerosporobacter sp.]
MKKKLLTFAIPYLLSNLVQSLYNVTDMIIVGKFAGKASMSGVAIGSQVTMFVTQLIIGLCSGTTALIGQQIGGKKHKDMEETVGTLFTILLLFGIVLTIGLPFLVKPILQLLQTPKESMGEASRFLTITCFGLIFIFMYNAFSAIMRGLGDSFRPFLLVGIACCTNVVLDLILVICFKMGAKGAAIATVVSQIVSMVLCFPFLRKYKFVFNFHTSFLGINKKRLGEIIRFGGPTAIQNVITIASFMVVTAIVNSLGVTASATVGAVSKITNFALMPVVALQASILVIGAQNIGAADYDGAETVMKIGMKVAFTISLIIFVIVQAIPKQLIGIFTSEPEVIQSGVIYIRRLSLDYFPATGLMCLVGLFIGAGHSKFCFVSSIFSAFLFRIPAAYLLGIYWNQGLKGVGFAAPIASTAALVLATLFYTSGKWKKRLPKLQEALDVSCECD